ncbi:MAG: FkbM family methyltransferase [Candidatus Paceibacterota bacterium]
MIDFKDYYKKIKRGYRKILFIHREVSVRDKSKFYPAFLYLQIAVIGLIGKYIPGVKNLFNRYRKRALSDHILIKSNVGFFHATVRNDSFMKSMPFFEQYCQSWLDKAENKKVFVDIGANIGFFTLLALNNKGFQKALAFEPTPDTFKRLQQNVATNNLEGRARLFNKAIGKERAQLKLQQNEFHTGGNTVIEESEDENLISVDVAPFPDLLDETDVKIANIGFIKIDVEGFELNVLQGMKDILKELVLDTLIFVEIREKDNNKKEVQNLLKDNKFKLIDFYDSNFLYIKI